MAHAKPSKHVKAASAKVRRLRQKLRAIVAAKSWTDDQYRAWLAAEYGLTSTKQLTERELEEAIRKQGGNPAARRRAKAPHPDTGGSKRESATAPQKKDGDEPWAGRYEGRGSTGFAGFLTQPQADYIARLEHELGWADDPRRLQGFIRRQLGLPENVVKPVQNLRLRQATKVITGLKRLK
jgi:hypothetical protein